MYGEEKLELELAKYFDNSAENLCKTIFDNVSIEISGHTDNQGSREHNTKLSKNRAKTVYDYLIAHEIVANRLTYKGYGFDKPIGTNDTAEGRANNRRTEFKIIGL